jgi:hypothetical protein
MNVINVKPVNYLIKNLYEIVIIMRLLITGFGNPGESRLEMP